MISNNNITNNNAPPTSPEEEVEETGCQTLAVMVIKTKQPPKWLITNYLELRYYST